MEPQTEPRHRRSRSKPQAKSGYFEVTENTARRLFEPLSRYKCLPTDYLVAFYGGRHAKRRLTHLFHEPQTLPAAQRLLTRPRELNHNINNKTIHELGPGALPYLHHYGLVNEESAGWIATTKIGATERSAHDLLVILCMASIELAVRKTPNVRFVNHLEILKYVRCSQEAREAKRPLEFPIPEISHTFPSGKQVTLFDTYVEPDALFGLEYRLPNGAKDWKFFALEVDRGTETVEPTSDLEKSSWLRKIITYDAVTERHIYRTYLGIKNLMVLSVVPDASRMQRIKGLVARNRGQYLFKLIPPFAKFQNSPPPMPHLFTEAWQRVHDTFNISTIEGR